jgi:GTP-binding protein EngB required for normal cell division
VYLLINASHGVTSADAAVLEELDGMTRLRISPFSIQVVLTKCDRLRPGKVTTEHVQKILERVQASVPSHPARVICTAAKASDMGVDEIRRDMIDAAAYVFELLVSISTVLNNALQDV